jgi:ABC-2 type transport system ATP-binding protein
MSKGKLIAQGSIDELSKSFGQGKVIIEISLSETSTKMVDAIRSVRGVISIKRDDNTVAITCNEDLRYQISKVISENNGLITQMKLQDFGLDEIYTKILKES